MNKSTLVNSLLATAGLSTGASGGLSIDSIVSPITSISSKLRDASKAKAEEATRKQEQIAALQQEVRDLYDESDRAFRIAEQLDGLVL